MKLALDVHYHDTGATVAGLLFPEWTAATVASEHLLTLDKVAPYETGAFYKRELPCLLALLETLPEQPETIVIDGFVTLGAQRRPGLGAHLYRALGQDIPVIGVAKSPFRGTPPETELLRGSSKTPLYVTAAGLPLSEARDRIAGMHGPYRMPTLLTRVDHLCREGA